jgi:hypothetical protein
MAMGLVEFNGTIEAGSMVTAPFSGRACAYWEVDISTTSGKRRGWRIVHRNASGNPFYVRDDTGLALVYPKGAECRVHFGKEEELLGIAVPDHYASYMEGQRLRMRHVWRLSAMRFRERILEEGQSVYVLGTATPRARAVAVSAGDELEATGTEGMRSRRVSALQEETAAVIRQGEHERTFIISQDSEHALMLTLGARAIGQLIGGPLLALLGLGGLLVTFSGHMAK